VQKALNVSFWFFWYRTVPSEILFYFKIIYFKLLDTFSVKIILDTFFEPWKRDVLYVKTAPLNIRIYVWTSNQISRLVGATLRGTVLFGFGLSMILWFLGLLFVFIFWLFFPVLLIGLLILGIYYVLKGGIYG